MQKPPTTEQIKDWLLKKRPLGISGITSIKDIDPKPWSGHFNYLVVTPERKFVLRFKGPEWGESAQGIVDEYENLKRLESYAFGPRVFGLEMDFFGEPVMFMEYLEFKALNTIETREQTRLFPAVAKLIAGINRVPYADLGLRLSDPYTTYDTSKTSWRRRLEVIRKIPQLTGWTIRLEKILPRADAMLDKFEPRLRRILAKHGQVLIFASSHIGHCVVTGQGLRLLNWEKLASGDPSFTLAVFLASIINHPDFERIKASMIKQYLKDAHVPEFPELIEQRLAEREISNLFWVLWAYANRGDTAPPDEATGAPERYERVLRLLKEMSS